MDKPIKCYYCGCADIVPITEELSFKTRKGRNIVNYIHSLRCTECGNLISFVITTEEDRDNVGSLSNY